MWRAKDTQVMIFTPLCFLFSLCGLEKTIETYLFLNGECRDDDVGRGEVLDHEEGEF